MLGHATWSFFIQAGARFVCSFMPSHPTPRTFASLAKASPIGSASQMQAWSGFRGGLKTEEKMRKATLHLQPRETLVVQKIKAEPCSHAVDLERYETRPAFPFAFGRHAQNTVLIVSPPG